MCFVTSFIVTLEACPVSFSAVRRRISQALASRGNGNVTRRQPRFKGLAFCSMVFSDCAFERRLIVEHWKKGDFSCSVWCAISSWQVAWETTCALLRGLCKSLALSDYRRSIERLSAQH
ncbi:hypothetical protein Ae201684_005615 [Aphanomyces euteiches]|uniref:Uncharacterized protein n=1 Tax=Aphanomyces euteiches TaxID=100861 RepID=A0A6G0XED1_9STRA|nr:hypothetical protein Ae201684_005615 [Aphanomyces euteiches]